MSEYGLKILNYMAGSIWGVSQGTRYAYDTTPAMLTNSLFLDFMKENGLKIYKGVSTRDIICIDFQYGSRTFKDEMSHLKKLAVKARLEYKKAKGQGHTAQINKAKKKRKSIERMYQQALLNEDKYVKKTKEELRIEYYTNGVDIKYPKYNKKSREWDYEVIHYKMLYRTPGKAKKGSCMFIRKSLYNKAHRFLTMGIKIPKKNSPIVEIGAYQSLITSSIEGKVRIPPQDILVLKDVDSFFKTNVISIEIDENKHCKSVPKENYEVCNTIFDGQALIDESIFPDWGDGYVLLRQHFFKAAAFCTKIQTFFRDYFGDDYEIATVTDMWGNKHLAKDIKMITTDQAIKWIKFDGITYEYWSEKVHELSDEFGIVKTAHRSKMGDMQRMSYQMVNAMSVDIMDDVLADTKEYVQKLKNDDEVFFEFLRRNLNFMSDYEVLLALCEHNPDFVKSDYFRERRSTIIQNYLLDIKTGHIVQNGDNLVLVGSPYALLLHSVGEDVEQDPTFEVEDGTIQCYTARFEDGEYLAEFRSPFNSCHNLGYLHNKYHPYWDKYFDLGKQIIVVNTQHTDFEDRNNGSDFDSDMIYVTNQKNIVERAKYCYINYPTIVNNIPKEKNIYDNSLYNQAIIDNKLAASQRDIGESTNVAQICLSYWHTTEDDKFASYADALAVLCQCSIDGTKRAYSVSVADEVKRYKETIKIKQNGYPAFWRDIRRDCNKNLINYNLQCPMNAVHSLTVGRAEYKNDIIPINEFFVNHPNEETQKKSKCIEQLIEKYNLELSDFNSDKKKNKEKDYNDYLLLRSDYEDLLEDIRRISLPNKYLGIMSWLINRCFMITPGTKRNRDKIQSKLNKNRSLLLKILYDLNPEMLLKCFKNG
jgi:hypothetical protein